MPTKTGGGGHQQRYDSNGRYSKTICPGPQQQSKKEKAKNNEIKRRKYVK